MSELLLLQMFDYKVRREGIHQEKRGGSVCVMKNYPAQSIKKRGRIMIDPPQEKREEKYV
jgi:hypothetical protein